MARGPQSKEKKIGKEGSISRRSRRQREKATAAAMCRRPRFLSGLLLLLARFDSPPMSPGGTGRSGVWLSFHVKSGNERSTPGRALVGQPPSSGSGHRLLFLDADVLFLIPRPWISPVWFPLMVSVLAILAVLFARDSGRGG